MAHDTALNSLVDAIAEGIASRLKETLFVGGPRLEPLLLTIKEAATYIGRSEQSVQHLVFKRELPVVRVGRRIHLDRRDLEAWIEANKY